MAMHQKCSEVIVCMSHKYCIVWCCYHGNNSFGLDFVEFDIIDILYLRKWNLRGAIFIIKLS